MIKFTYSEADVPILQKIMEAQRYNASLIRTQVLETFAKQNASWASPKSVIQIMDDLSDSMLRAFGDLEELDWTR